MEVREVKKLERQVKNIFKKHKKIKMHKWGYIQIITKIYKLKYFIRIYPPYPTGDINEHLYLLRIDTREHDNIFRFKTSEKLCKWLAYHIKRKRQLVKLGETMTFIHSVF